MHVPVRKKYTVNQKILIRNLVLIRNKFNRILNFFHNAFVYTLIRKKLYTQISAVKVPSFLVFFDI